MKTANSMKLIVAYCLTLFHFACPAVSVGQVFQCGNKYQTRPCEQGVGRTVHETTASPSKESDPNYKTKLELWRKVSGYLYFTESIRAKNSCLAPNVSPQTCAAILLGAANRTQERDLMIAYEDMRRAAAQKEEEALQARDSFVQALRETANNTAAIANEVSRPRTCRWTGNILVCD